MGNQQVDKRDEILLDFCTMKYLFVANNEESPSTYQCRQGYASVNLTIVRFKKNSELNNWKVQEDESRQIIKR